MMTPSLQAACPRRLGWLVGLLLCGLLSAAALLLSLRSWDISLFNLLNNLGRALPLGAEFITHLADYRWTSPLLIILLAQQPRLLAAALLSALFIHFSVHEFKHYFQVLRPCYAPHLAGQVFTAGPRLNIDSFSFPSGHSATASLIAVALVVVGGGRALIPALLFALAVAASRAMLGAHFPSDTAAGLALGLGISSGVFYLMSRPQAWPQSRQGAARVSALVGLLAAGLLIFILQEGQHTYPFWFAAASKITCLAALGVLLWRQGRRILKRSNSA